MGETFLKDSLTEAWALRLKHAQRDLRYAAQAPGLFKPEFVVQRQLDYMKAYEQASFFGGQQ